VDQSKGSDLCIMGVRVGVAIFFGPIDRYLLFLDKSRGIDASIDRYRRDGSFLIKR